MTFKLAGLAQFSGADAGFSGCAIVNVAAETVREAYPMRLRAQGRSMTDHSASFGHAPGAGYSAPHSVGIGAKLDDTLAVSSDDGHRWMLPCHGACPPEGRSRLPGRAPRALIGCPPVPSRRACRRRRLVQSARAGRRPQPRDRRVPPLGVGHPGRDAGGYERCHRLRRTWDRAPMSPPAPVAPTRARARHRHCDRPPRVAAHADDRRDDAQRVQLCAALRRLPGPLCAPRGAPRRHGVPLGPGPAAEAVSRRTAPPRAPCCHGCTSTHRRCWRIRWRRGRAKRCTSRRWSRSIRYCTTRTAPPGPSGSPTCTASGSGSKFTRGVTDTTGPASPCFRCPPAARLATTRRRRCRRWPATSSATCRWRAPTARWRTCARPWRSSSASRARPSRPSEWRWHRSCSVLRTSPYLPARTCIHSLTYLLILFDICYGLIVQLFLHIHQPAPQIHTVVCILRRGDAAPPVGASLAGCVADVRPDGARARHVGRRVARRHGPQRAHLHAGMRTNHGENARAR